MSIDELKYPALLFREGYVFAAKDAGKLRLLDRRTFDETVNSNWQLVDSAGALFRVTRWEKIPRPSGLKGLASALLGGTFAEPILVFERNLTLQDLIREIAPMFLRNRMYGNAYGNNEQAFREDLRNVNSFRELFKFLESAP